MMVASEDAVEVIDSDSFGLFRGHGCLLRGVRFMAADPGRARSTRARSGRDGAEVRHVAAAAALAHSEAAMAVLEHLGACFGHRAHVRTAQREPPARGVTLDERCIGAASANIIPESSAAASAATCLPVVLVAIAVLPVRLLTRSRSAPENFVQWHRQGTWIRESAGRFRCADRPARRAATFIVPTGNSKLVFLGEPEGW